MSVTEALELLYSSICGLEHLHKEIKCVSGSKPSMAHRDIKSKNILVNQYGRAIIADLGFAITYDSDKNQIDLPSESSKLFILSSRYTYK